jgi:hypothetical protein
MLFAYFSGVFAVSSGLTADEMRALLYQLIFCIGTQPDIIYSDARRKRLVKFLWMLMTTVDLLWCIYGHSELQLRAIHLCLKSCMRECKKVFRRRSWFFIKFHFLVHLCDVVRWFGSLRIVDTRFGEQLHKPLKKTYLRTRRHKNSCREEASRVIGRIQKVHFRSRDLEPVANLTHAQTKDRYFFTLMAVKLP